MKFHPQQIKDVKELICKSGFSVKYKITNNRQYFVIDSDSLELGKIIRNYFPGARIVNGNKSNKISFRLNPES